MLLWPCQSQDWFLSSWPSATDLPPRPSSLTGQMRFLRNRPGPHSPVVFAVPTSVLACANLALHLRPLRSPSRREPFLPQGGGFRKPSGGSHWPWGPLLLLPPLHCALSTCLCVFLPPACEFFGGKDHGLIWNTVNIYCIHLQTCGTRLGSLRRSLMLRMLKN